MPRRTTKSAVSKLGFIRKVGHSGCKSQNITVRALKGGKCSLPNMV